jgi:hypothetical protein
MPYLNLTGGEPWAETWGVMLFPDNEAKRRAFVAGLWLGFYPAYEKSGTGEAVPRSVLLSVMEAAAAGAVERDEIADRRYRGLAAGDQLKVLFALAQTQSKRASWNAATRLVEWQSGKCRAYLYEARGVFLPVIHLWGRLSCATSDVMPMRLVATPRSTYKCSSSRQWRYCSGPRASSWIVRRQSRR